MSKNSFEARPRGYNAGLLASGVCLKFHRKVSVFGNGKYIFSAHPNEAARLVESGATLLEVKKSVVHAIELPLSDTSTQHPQTPSGTALGGTKFTYDEALSCGFVVQHRLIHKDDEPLFRQVQLDCMAHGGSE